MTRRKRYAIVGTGSRAGMYVRATTETFVYRAQLVGMCDLSHTRMNWYNRQLQQNGASPVPTYHAEDFDAMIAETRPDTVIVTTMDAWHHHYIVRAMEQGCDVLCEKPLASSADEAYATWKGVEAAGVFHMCAFMHRSIAALNLARTMIRSGELGEIRHFRSRFLLNMRSDDGNLNWRFSRTRSGLGSLGDLGSHHVDQARFLVAEVARVAAVAKTWSSDARGAITDVNDDAFVCAAELENGATASFEASRVAAAHNLGGWIEVDGSKRSLSWHMERLNELVVYEPGLGPRSLMVTRAGHPYCDFWLPVGVQGQHSLGWSECFAHQARHMLEAVALGHSVAPRATFEDGYRVAEIVDAMERSATSRQFEEIRFRK